MGRPVDLDQPLSDEDKAYLQRRGRGYLILANERRFGADGKATPAEHEKAGQPTANAFYDNAEREKAVYDVGGVPLPGTILDKDTGRVYERENGVELVEPTFGTQQPGQYANPGSWQDGRDDDDSDIDEDIESEVLALNVEELKDRLREEDEPVSGNKAELQERLAIHLQDKRDGRK